MYLCEKYYKPSTVSAIYPTVLLGYSRLILLDLEQIGLMNVLLEQNSFECRGLTVYNKKM